MYYIHPKAALFLLVATAVYILWERYAEGHDNWLTRFVEWNDEHSETIMIVGGVIVLIGAVVAALFLFSIKN